MNDFAIREDFAVRMDCAIRMVLTAEASAPAAPSALAATLCGAPALHARPWRGEAKQAEHAAAHGIAVAARAKQRFPVFHRIAPEHQIG